MGRNGKKPPVFADMVNFINNNVGKIVSSEEILLGEKPGRNVKTAYLYKFIKLGYVVPVDMASYITEAASYKIARAFPEHYTSVMMKNDLKKVNGYATSNN